jgi:hypothetical protein
MEERDVRERRNREIRTFPEKENRNGISKRRGH